MTDHKPVTDEEAAEFRRVEEDASPGEWYVGHAANEQPGVLMTRYPDGYLEIGEWDWSPENKALAIAARNLVPRLLVDRERMKAEVDRALKFETTCEKHGEGQVTTCVACRWDVNARAEKAERERDQQCERAERAEAVIQAAGNWPQTVAKLEEALSTFPAGRAFLKQWNDAERERDEMREALVHAILDSVEPRLRKEFVELKHERDALRAQLAEVRAHMTACKAEDMTPGEFVNALRDDLTRAEIKLAARARERAKEVLAYLRKHHVDECGGLHHMNTAEEGIARVLENHPVGTRLTSSPVEERGMRIDYQGHEDLQSQIDRLEGVVAFLVRRFHPVHEWKSCGFWGTGKRLRVKETCECGAENMRSATLEERAQERRTMRGSLKTTGKKRR